MDKQVYKDMLADSYSETNKYKKIVRVVEQMVKDEPNNMKLGKIIRQLYWDLKDKRDLANEKI